MRDSLENNATSSSNPSLQEIPRLDHALTFWFCISSRQPWSAYAVHLTTLSPPALLGDLLLVLLCHKATASWDEGSHIMAMQVLGVWMFISKFIKLVGHYIRYPVDVLLLPVSILFGYFHGAIKMYAVLTLNVVSCMINSPVPVWIFSSLHKRLHDACLEPTLRSPACPGLEI